MNVVRKVAGTVAAAALVTGGALAAVESADAAASTHTLKFTAVTLKSSQFRNAFVQAEKDVQNGKVTGYDTVSCVFNATTHKGSCDAGVARANGLIYVHVVIGQSGRGSGKVTGGTRAYKGATGTVVTAPGANQNQTKITISYTR